MLKNFRRLGVFVINLSIVGMFYQIIAVPIALYVSFTLEYFFIDVLILIFYIVLWIAVYMGYQLINYNLLKTTIAHKLLSMQIIKKNKKELTKQEYLKREYFKVKMLFATLGIYYIYNFILVILLAKETVHDKKYKTKVIPLKY